MIRIAHANGSGKCRLCGQLIPKGNKQVIEEVLRSSGRMCTRCSESFLIKHLQKALNLLTEWEATHDKEKS